MMDGDELRPSLTQWGALLHEALQKNGKSLADIQGRVADKDTMSPNALPLAAEMFSAKPPLGTSHFQSHLSVSLSELLSSLNLSHLLPVLRELGFEDPSRSLAGVSAADLLTWVGKERIKPGEANIIARACKELFSDETSGQATEFYEFSPESWQTVLTTSGKEVLRTLMWQALQMHRADAEKRRNWEVLKGLIDHASTMTTAGGDISMMPDLVKSIRSLIDGMRARDFEALGLPGYRALKKVEADKRGDRFLSTLATMTQRPRSNQPSGSCFRCGLPGHWASQCRSSPFRNPPRASTAFAGARAAFSPRSPFPPRFPPRQGNGSGVLGSG